MMHHRLSAIAIAAALTLGACAQHKAPGPAFQSYADGTQGKCFAQRQELERQGSRFETSFKAPPRQPGDRFSVAAQYLTSLVAGARSLTGMLDVFIGDIERETQWAGWTADAFDELTLCHTAHRRAIRAGLRAGRIDHATASARIDELNSSYREDIERFRQIADQIARNTAAYVEIYNDFALNTEADPIEISPVPASRPGRPQASAGRQTPLVRFTAPVRSEAPGTRPVLDRAKQRLLTNARKRDELFERIVVAESADTELNLARAGHTRLA